MTAGVIFTGFGTKDYVHQSLAPWIELRASGGPDKIVICAVSIRFAGFEGEDDGTGDILRGYLAEGKIDYVIDGWDNIPETAARSMALRKLGDECDVIIQWDSDEIPSSSGELEDILTFVKQNPYTAWFRLSYRNVVFTPDTYLQDAFTPPRIHRMYVDGYRLHSFSGDNDIQYGGTITRDLKPQEHFPSMTIPWSIAVPKHFTWLNDERSKKKVAYQKRRWGHCSFDWDDSKGGLIFNPAFPAPKIWQTKP